MSGEMENVSRIEAMGNSRLILLATVAESVLRKQMAFIADW
jgi:hypothetical protein